MRSECAHVVIVNTESFCSLKSQILSTLNTVKGFIWEFSVHVYVVLTYVKCHTCGSFFTNLT